MFGYIVRRVFTALLVLILTSMIVFGIFFLGPKNPAKPLCEAQQRCTPEKLERLERADGPRQAGARRLRQVGQGPLRRAHRRVLRHGTTFDCSAPCLGISYSNNARGHRRAQGEVSRPRCPWPSAARSSTCSSASPPACSPPDIAAPSIDRALVTSTLVVSAIPYYLIALLAWIFLTQRYSVFPETQYNPFLDNPVAWAGGLAPALAGARPDQRHAVLPLHPRPDGRDAGRGLHPHRDRQGSEGERRGLQARSARCDHPGRHHLRSRLRDPAGRHDLHRVHLRHRGHGPLGPGGCGRPSPTSRW